MGAVPHMPRRGDSVKDWTVIGVWEEDEAIPVGVIEGKHGVSGGDSARFQQGCWATSVTALDAATAEELAIEEMSGE